MNFRITWNEKGFCWMADSKHSARIAEGRGIKGAHRKTPDGEDELDYRGKMQYMSIVGVLRYLGRRQVRCGICDTQAEQGLGATNRLI